MEEKVISLDKFVQDKLEMLKVEKEIVKEVRLEYLQKLIRLASIEGVGITLVLMNDNLFGKLMILPSIIFALPLLDMTHNIYIKCRDIKQLTKEINKLNARQ